MKCAQRTSAFEGEYDALGELVSRNTPEFLPSLKKSGSVATRMDLAEWFVQADNPLLRGWR